MIDLFYWLQAHWFDIVTAIGLIVSGVSLIVKITPTLKDDNFWLPIVKFLSKYIALNRTTNDAAIRQEEEMMKATENNGSSN